ncbi:MAG: hypothetical protein ACRD3W_25170 [Terriglobales bacterium]
MDRQRFVKVALVAVAVSGAYALTLANPSYAQGGPGAGRVNKQALEKADFYHAPRQIDIVDDRPVVRDFREAPQQPQSIELPPAPQGWGGSGYSPGGPGLGGGPGGTIPAGGMPLGGNQGYRTPGGGSLPLPKSGFGGSNIPARGMGPAGALPTGDSTNRLMGKMLNPGVAKGMGAGPARGMQPTAGRTNGNYGGPPVATYSGGYGNGTGSGYGGSASRTDAMVRGSLLHK